VIINSLSIKKNITQNNNIVGVQETYGAMFNALIETDKNNLKIIQDVSKSTLQVIKNITKLSEATKSMWFTIRKMMQYDLKLKASIFELDKYIQLLHKKPSYQYMKKRTVFISGEKVKIVKLELQRGDKYFPIITKWVATGVVADKTKTHLIILTNKHVVGGKVKPNIHIYVQTDMGDKRFLTKVVKIHPKEDLAIIKIPLNSRIRKEKVEGLDYPIITESVYMVSNAMARRFVYGQGYFSGMDAKCDLYQLPCMPGSSGAGIFNKWGKLVGVTSYLSGAPVGKSIAWDVTHTCAVKSVYIHQFLRDVR